MPATYGHLSPIWKIILRATFDRREIAACISRYLLQNRPVNEYTTTYCLVALSTLPASKFYNLPNTYKSYCSLSLVDISALKLITCHT
jgi:hypothetical protein